MRVSEAGTEAAFFGAMRELTDPQVVARFTVDGEPASKSRARFVKRGSKTRAYTPEKTRTAEVAVGWAFRAARPVGAMVKDAEYGVVALFFCATRQRRDVDNMVKLVLDGLNGVAFHDDSQVTEVTGRKSYVDTKDAARTEVLVYRLGSRDHKHAICKGCGEKFRTYASWEDKKVWCSRECRQRHLARRTEQRACEHCGAEFEAPRRSEKRFCSTQCGTDARGKVEATCDLCGTKFTRFKSYMRARNFCSTTCRDTDAAEHRAKAAKGTCADCGGPTSKKAYKRCRECNFKAGSGWDTRRAKLYGEEVEG